MSGYTPTTDRVREVWAATLFDGGASEEEKADSEWDWDRSGAQFDRWLASVKAEAWNEGSDHGYDYRLAEEQGSLNEDDRHGNPYEQS